MVSDDTSKMLDFKQRADETEPARSYDIHFVLSHQHPSGAYPASPSYSQYPYCWLRDGSFIAYSMDRVGRSDSAASFHQWVARTLLGRADLIDELIDRGRRGEEILEHEFLPARFTLEGDWRQDGWPNFQLDGYGHWLWSLGQHFHQVGPQGIASEVKDAAELVSEYLSVFWQEPCYDAWEEYRSQLHTSTLASIHGGLAAMASTIRPGFHEKAEEVRSMILRECAVDERFVKHIGNSIVDSSLLWLSTPFGVVGEDHVLMANTVREIEAELCVSGGLRRYAADTFYGGGEWVLLTAWLGWYYARLGNVERARECLAWIESQRDDSGALPEQVRCPASNERFLEFWTKRWGASAKPLLWSHAMSLVLKCELAGCNG